VWDAIRGTCVLAALACLPACLSTTPPVPHAPSCRLRSCLATISGHSQPIQSIAWGGEGLLYTASRDRTIMCWDTKGQLGKLVRQLKGALRCAALGCPP
jgi:WD40 repeat protein